jgi:hypothetical protein
VIVGVLVGLDLRCPRAEPPSEVAKLNNPKACPVGSYQDNSAGAGEDCSGQARLAINNAKGNLEAKCIQKNGYVVKCVVDTTWCKYGAKTLTVDKLECAEAPCPGCTVRDSDGVCAPMPVCGKCENRNPQSCACEPMRTRCGTCQRWSDDLCACTSAPICGPCDQLDPQTCKCKAITMSCPQCQVWSHDTCSCISNAPRCNTCQSLDVTSCQCKPITRDCPHCKTWHNNNVDQCSCVPNAPTKQHYKGPNHHLSSQREGGNDDHKDVRFTDNATSGCEVIASTVRATGSGHGDYSYGILEIKVSSVESIGTTIYHRFGESGVLDFWIEFDEICPCR